MKTSPPTDEQVQRLADANAQYQREVSKSYDDVLREVSQRIAGSGCIGKADVGAVVFWKRLRADTPWAGDLNATPDADVRAITARAVTAVRDPQMPLADAARAGRAALSDLPGFSTGDALASALLTAAAPDRMAVYDRRAHTGLDLLGITLTQRPGRYSRYMAELDRLTRAANTRGLQWRPRDVDLALYWLAGGS